MRVLQKQITLPNYNRGFHLITSIIYREFPEIQTIEKGIVHIQYMVLYISL